MGLKLGYVGAAVRTCPKLWVHGVGENVSLGRLILSVVDIEGGHHILIFMDSIVAVNWVAG